MLDLAKIKEHCLNAIGELSKALEYAKEDDSISPHLTLMIERGKLRLYRLRQMLAVLENQEITDNKKIEQVRGWIKDLSASIRSDMRLNGLVQECIVKEAKAVDKVKRNKTLVAISEAEAAELAAL